VKFVVKFTQMESCSRCGQLALFQCTDTITNRSLSCGRAICNAAVLFVGRKAAATTASSSGQLRLLDPPVRVQGITNIGNICWINPVLQALARLRGSDVRPSKAPVVPPQWGVAGRVFDIVHQLRNPPPAAAGAGVACSAEEAIGSEQQTDPRLSMDSLTETLQWLTTAFNARLGEQNDLTEFVVSLLDTFASGRMFAEDTEEQQQQGIVAQTPLPVAHPWVSLFRWRKRTTTWSPDGGVGHAQYYSTNVKDTYEVFRLYLDPEAPWQTTEYLLGRFGLTVRPSEVRLESGQPLPAANYQPPEHIRQTFDGMRAAELAEVRKAELLARTLPDSAAAADFPVTEEVRAKMTVALHRIETTQKRKSIARQIAAADQFASVVRLQHLQQVLAGQPITDLTTVGTNRIRKMLPGERTALAADVRTKLLTTNIPLLADRTAKNTIHSIRWTTVETPPPVLLIELSRSRYGALQEGGQGVLATETIVPFLEELTLPRELWPSDTAAAAALPPTYQLFAVIVRDGFEGSGHFFLYTIAADGEWYWVSDEFVRPVPRTDVFKAAATMLWYAML